MAREVSSDTTLGRWRRRYGVDECCERLDLDARFDSAIQGLLNSLEGRLSLDAPTVDRMLIESVEAALQVGPLKRALEEDLDDNFDLSDSWDDDETMWDRYWTVVAVTVIQRHYDSHGVG